MPDQDTPGDQPAGSTPPPDDDARGDGQPDAHAAPTMAEAAGSGGGAAGAGPQSDLDTFASDMVSGKKRAHPFAGFLPDRPRLELQTDAEDYDDDIPPVFVLDGDQRRLGRSGDNHFVIRQSVISSNHCEFYLTTGAWHVRDLGSTNGVRVNGQRVEESELRPGDIINFDIITYIFVDPTRPVKESEDAKLVVLAGNVTQKVFALGPTLTVGRRAGNSIVVEGDSSVSSHHARIDRDDKAQRFRITDLGSRNGTKVDGVSILAHTATALLNGSKVQIGKLVLRVVDLHAPDSPVTAEITSRQLEAAAEHASKGRRDDADEKPSEVKTDRIEAIRREQSPAAGDADGRPGPDETSDDVDLPAARGGNNKPAPGDDRRPRPATTPVASRTRVSRTTENVTPAKRRTVRDYGRQLGIFWGVALAMSLLVVLIFRIATAASSDVGWPGGFGPNFLIFLPLVQALITGWVVFKADRHTRGPLLLLIALAPWLYAGNLKINEYGAIYEQVPTSFHNISFGLDPMAKGTPGYQRYMRLLADEIGDGDRALTAASVLESMQMLRQHYRDEVIGAAKQFAKTPDDHAFVNALARLNGEASGRGGLVQFSNSINLHNTGVLLFPVIALLILGLAPGLAISVARRYHARRPQLAKLHIVSIGGLVLYFLAVAVVALVDTNTGQALANSALTFPFVLILLFPMAALVLFILDWMKPTPRMNAITRWSLQGFLFALYLWWTLTGVIGALQWFVENPDGVRNEQVTLGGRVIQESDMIKLIPEAKAEKGGTPVYRRTRIVDTPMGALARSIQHSFALFLLLFANIGLLVCGTVDIITSVVMPDDDDPAWPQPASGGTIRGPAPAPAGG
ncbi:MAG: FHA domain-containing protein [Planctomycetota bacterium]